MSDDNTHSVLEDIRDILNEQLKTQQAAIDMQKEQFSMAKKQFDRAEKINDRAEAIQEKSARIVASGGKLLKVVTPLLVLLIAYALWMVIA